MPADVGQHVARRYTTAPAPARASSDATNWRRETMRSDDARRLPRRSDPSRLCRCGLHESHDPRTRVGVQGLEGRARRPAVEPCRVNGGLDARRPERADDLSTERHQLRLDRRRFAGSSRTAPPQRAREPAPEQTPPLPGSRRAPPRSGPLAESTHSRSGPRNRRRLRAEESRQHRQISAAVLHPYDVRRALPVARPTGRRQVVACMYWGMLYSITGTGLLSAMRV